LIGQTSFLGMVRSVYFFLFHMFIEKVAERAIKIVYVDIDDNCVVTDGADFPNNKTSSSS
jgi:hypothetical protein